MSTTTETEQHWTQLANDMKASLDKFYAPLTIDCSADIEHRCIDYSPPFYLHDKCNELSFGVSIDETHEPNYPLHCTSEIYKGVFVVQSPQDWEPHLDKFVVWKDEIESLIKKIRS